MKKARYFIFVIVLCIAAYFSFNLYKTFFEKNTLFIDDSVYVKIPTNSSKSQLLDSLSKYLIDIKTFEKAASKKKYINNIKAGRYLIEKGFPIKRIKRFSKGIIELEVHNGIVYVGLFDEGLVVLPSGDPNKSFHLFNDCSVSGVLLDKNESIWVTTQDQGIFYVPHGLFSHLNKASNMVITNISGNRKSIIYSNYEGSLFRLKNNFKLQMGLSSENYIKNIIPCLLYTSPSPRDRT